MNPLRVIISGGGTGGHIFPAIAIADALKEKYNKIEILFVGALGRMEMEKVPAAGYKIVGLDIRGFQRRLTLSHFVTLFKAILSLRKAKQIIKEFNPDVVVGVGGYASGPVLRKAAAFGIPTLIQEQNSYPGITNRILARRVNKICVAYERMEKYFPKDKIRITGNPVRQDVANLEGKKQIALEFFGLDANKKTVLVIGGSLGARTINESILKSLEELVANNIKLVWQTGQAFYKKAQQAVKNLEGKIKVVDFITKMDYSYAVADVVVSRAGAISISELCLVKKPSILIPSPNVAEDHQTKNAMMLVNHTAAILIKDAEAKEKLCTTLLDLMKDESKRNKLGNNIAQLGIKNSADLIAEEIFSLVKKK